MSYGVNQRRMSWRKNFLLVIILGNFFTIKRGVSSAIEKHDDYVYSLFSIRDSVEGLINEIEEGNIHFLSVHIKINTIFYRYNDFLDDMNDRLLPELEKDEKERGTLKFLKRWIKDTFRMLAGYKITEKLSIDETIHNAIKDTHDTAKKARKEQNDILYYKKMSYL